MSHGYVFALLCYIGRDDWYNVRCVYTYRREASRCSFRQIGQCEGLKDVERATSDWLHAFFYTINGTIVCHLRPVARINT